MGVDRIKGHLDGLILAVLADGARHGYDVITELRRRSGGEFDLPEGTVYPALHRLEHAGLLSSTWDSSGARRRRVYRLTAEGSRARAEAAQEWSRFSRGMSAVLGVS